MRESAPVRLGEETSDPGFTDLGEDPAGLTAEVEGCGYWSHAPSIRRTHGWGPVTICQAPHARKEPILVLRCAQPRP
ncbi:hypothetical protein GCM10009800_29730 [Nocardiopsis rhodophaea]